ncbi:MAG: PxxKW family cysteine-rich protein [Desulfobulbus sp.]|jgi:hypothetical protein
MQTGSARKFSDQPFLPVGEKCEGCERIVEKGEGRFCSTHLNPDAKWRLGICNLATHVKPEVLAITAKVNPLKASKRASKKKKK